MKTKIYTKTGDLGQTSLFGGPRVSKSNAVLEAYGTIDELNALLGLAIEILSNSNSKNTSNIKSLAKSLLQIQNDLFSIGSHLACAEKKWRDKLPTLDNKRIADFESEIDLMTNTLPELKEFILPGGVHGAALLHVARTVCRRAERATVSFYEETQAESTPGHKQDSTQEFIIKYLNRLSDFLFVAARFVNFENHIEDTKWKKP